MSGLRTLFLISLILGNMFLVLFGYETLLDGLHAALDNTYDNQEINQVLACSTDDCDNQELISQELNQSLHEIRDIYGSVLIER